jgi:metallo-beta-lactamase class B
MAKMDTWLEDPKYKKYRDAYRNTVFIEPTNVFDIKEKQIITIGTEKVEVFFPGPTHTYDNLVVYIPSKEILFGGCMIVSAEANKLGFIEDGNVNEWTKSIDNVKSQYVDIKIVVPGHGKVGGYDLLNHTIAIVNGFNRKQ